MLSLSGFVRKLIRDSVLAGVEDALRYLEPNAAAEGHQRLADQLADRLKRLHKDHPSTVTVDSGAAEGQSSGPSFAKLPNSKPASKPSPQKQPADPPQPDPRRRGPGRPKKQAPPYA